MAAPSTDSSFDPSGAVRFDLGSGAASDSRGERLVLVPSAAVAQLGADARTQIGQAIGRACGARVSARLGGEGGVRATQLEAVVTHLAGELAICGIGSIHLERWGRAMVVIVTNPSIDDEMFVGAVLGGAVSASSGREVAAAAIGREAGSARYFLGSPATADHVRVLVGKGMSHAEVLESLHRGAT